jgi:DNA-binding NarL/FixJ family response regulator
MKVLIADDHSLVREAMRSVLEEAIAGLSVIEVSTADAALSAVRQEAPDLVLLDLGLPDRNGLSLLAEFKKFNYQTRVAVLSAQSDESTIRRAFDSGAIGFIPKTTERRVILAALSVIIAGGIYVPPEILMPAGATLCASWPASGPLLKEQLGKRLAVSERQFDVLELMLAGKSNKSISRSLGIAEHTVKNHVTGVLKVLGASSRTEAVVIISRLLRDC